MVLSEPEVSLAIYDVAGRMVKSFNLESCIIYHESTIFWSGDDDLGRRLPGGVYFIELSIEYFCEIEKVVKVK